jgi:hypothetical protein
MELTYSEKLLEIELTDSQNLLELTEFLLNIIQIDITLFLLGFIL